MRGQHSLPVLIFFFLVPRLASPQGEPLGPEFRVNTAAPNNKQGDSSAASTGSDFVVVWDGSYGVVGQRFDSAGNALGTEFRVNTTLDTNWRPAVGANASGFVVVWENWHLVIPEPFPLYSFSMFGRRYAASGAPVGPEFRVNGPVGSYQTGSVVAVAPSGDFLVVWSRAISQAPPGPFDVLARRYDSAGVPQGPEFLVNAYTTGYQASPAVAADRAGNFVVVWSSLYPGSNGVDVIGRRYSASGEPLGLQFRVNTYTPGYQFGPAVATDPSGNFVVAWSSDSSGNPPEPGLFAQRFASGGAPIGPEFRVNTNTMGAQDEPAIAVDGGGNFVITWHEPTFGTGDVFGQRFSSLGEPSGPEFRVNTTTTGWQRNASVASTPGGVFLVTWDSGPNGLVPDDVYGQRFGGVFPVKLQELQVH